MTKKTRKKQQQSGFNLDRNAQIVIAVVLAILVVAVGVIAAGGGSAGDAVDVAADVPAEGLAAAPQNISPTQFQSQFAGGDGDYVLIDVRTPSEFADGHIPGAVNIPVQELGARLNEVPQGVPVVLYCRSGNRSAEAVNILDRAGFDGLYDLGGIIDWTAAGYTITN